MTVGDMLPRTSNLSEGSSSSAEELRRHMASKRRRNQSDCREAGNNNFCLCRLKRIGVDSICRAAGLKALMAICDRS